MNTITFLTRTGQTCTHVRQEFILLSDVLGVSALVDSLNNPPVAGGTESSVLGPFLTEDAPDGTHVLYEKIIIGSDIFTVSHGESIASEGKGDYMYVEGRVLSTEGNPIANAILETWETDSLGGYSIIALITQSHSTLAGYYDTQYANRETPDCRGRLVTDKDGWFGYRAVVPVSYPIPGDVRCILTMIDDSIILKSFRVLSGICYCCLVDTICVLTIYTCWSRHLVTKSLSLHCIRGAING